MSTQPPTTWRSMPCSSIQAKRPATSLSGFETGRVGLAPPNEKPRLPASSISRTEGNRAASALIVAKSSGGTRWAWESMIMGVASGSGGFGHARRDEVAQFADPHRELVHHDAE